MLSTSNLTIAFSQKPLFEDVSVKFEDGARYGLIGANGCGKSTFLKILSKKLEATHGTVNYAPNAKIASLNQDQFAFDEYMVLDAVIMGDQALWEIKAERERLYSQAELSDEDGIKVADLEGQFAQLDGYSCEARAGEILLSAGIDTELQSKKMADIAPGLKLRVLLAQVLFAKPDIMLLDEPTNNLDINTIAWLETALQKQNCTMIIISHDRHFLNQVCTHTADLDYGKIQLFPGNYDQYMVAATQARETLARDNARKKAKIQELQSFVSRFSANASKSKQATSRLKQIDKIELAEIKPSSRRFPYIQFQEEKKLHRLAVEVENLSFCYEDKRNLFNQASFQVEAGSRLGIIGPNGIGKTTLLKTLLGELQAQQGTVKWAENAKVGYFAQDHNDLFEQNCTLLDWMSQWGGPEDDEQVIRGVLGRMLFSSDAINKSTKVLSGGEKVRMLLGKLTLEKNNVLILDEPTNHLDMESIEALNQALENYPGSIIIVSHDRQLLGSLANEILEIMPNHDVIHYKDTLEEYLASKSAQTVG